MENLIPLEYENKKVPVEAGLGFGWEKSTIVEFFCSESGLLFSILGGDVAFLDESGVCCTSYDSWYVERKGPLESINDFRKRSREESLSYIKSYPEDKKYIFCPVMSTEVTAGL